MDFFLFLVSFLLLTLLTHGSSHRNLFKKILAPLHVNMNNNSSFLEIKAFDAPKTSQFLTEIFTLCPAFKKDNAGLFQCLHDNFNTPSKADDLKKAAPTMTKIYSDKKFGEQKANKDTGTIVVGFGPVGAYMALKLRLEGYPVAIIERDESFHQRQAISSGNFGSLLEGYGLDFSTIGLCKNVIQYVILGLSAMFPDGVSFTQGEVIGFDGKAGILAIQWKDGIDRAAKRAWLQEKKIYHVDYQTWPKPSDFNYKQLTEDDKKVVKKFIEFKSDFVFASSGAQDSFHYILPGVNAQWNKGVDECAAVSSVSSIAKFKLELKVENVDEDDLKLRADIGHESLGDDLLYTQWSSTAIKKKGDGLYQGKFVPYHVYFPTAPNEIWIERLWSVTQVEAAWDALNKYILKLADRSQGFAKVLSHSLILDTDAKLEQEFFFNWFIEAADFEKAVTKLFTHLTTKYQANYEEEENKATAGITSKIENIRELRKKQAAAAAEKKKNAFLVPQAMEQLSTFYVSNRLISKKNIVTTLSLESGKEMKVIFIGDSFRESLFSRGNGVQTHLAELSAPEVKASSSGAGGHDKIELWCDFVTPAKLAAWVEYAYSEGVAYAIKSAQEMGVAKK